MISDFYIVSGVIIFLSDHGDGRDITQVTEEDTGLEKMVEELFE